LTSPNSPKKKSINSKTKSRMSIESISQKIAASQQHQAGYVKNKIRNQKLARGSRAQVQEHPPKYATKVRMPKIVRTLLSAIDEDDIDKVARVWREAMDATTMTYDLPSKTWVERPDHNTRIKAANMVAAYKEGLPVQRQIQLQGNIEDLNATLERIQSSPEAARAMQLLGGFQQTNSLQNTAQSQEKRVAGTDSTEAGREIP
jgi:hypothetical protein